MPLITMPREMGSLGKDVAALIAQQFGKKVVHHEIIDQLANKLRLRKSHVVRFLEGKAGMWEKMTTDQTSLSIYTADEILRMAVGGDVAVIRGWGAPHLLEDIPHVLRVRVCAPFELRVQRMMARLNTDDRAFVEKEIRLADEAITAITRRHFDINWEDAEHYDVMLNTERMSVEECATQVINTLKSDCFSPTPASLQKLHDKALAAHVTAALRADERTEKLRITVKIAGGHATLSGIVEDEATLKPAAEIAAAVSGVKGVTNQLKSTYRAHHRFDS